MAGWTTCRKSISELADDWRARLRIGLSLVAPPGKWRHGARHKSAHRVRKKCDDSKDPKSMEDFRRVYINIRSGRHDIRLSDGNLDPLKKMLDEPNETATKLIFEVKG